MEQKNRMLIDATHPEETRVVVLRNGRVEEFDYESAARKLLRGNIYLAKVTRVEPSLQAAFIDYGGNRHGFLAFSEIHPDYYQIPVADRQALLQEEADAEAEAEAEADARAEARARRSEARSAERGEPDAGGPEAMAAEAPAEERLSAAEPYEDNGRVHQESGRTSPNPPAPEFHGVEPHAMHNATPHNETSPSPVAAEALPNGAEEQSQDAGHVEEIVSDPAEVPEMVSGSVEQVGTEDALEEVPERPRRRMRSYKIQEVIKRRQIILVQVVKEERGSKGAALTTYLSMAGRYTVLMPNSGRGGGISRKITNPQDRKRLKAIAHELEVPEGMGLIIRTAGAARTRQEIKRDFEYLLRLWENVRDLTLQSTAPCLVYEEGNLIKRSIRDLYSKDIDEIQVAGESAHREAQDFMRMLSPSQAKNVIRFEEPEPLFARYQIERQLNAMFSPYVTLRSGGYLVINQTEALVSIDVNSGKATREYSIEETALQTNLEASEEIARQLKLRDLAGLIVIDFIDMEERRNNRKVEGRLKDALRHDRARIQVGRISHFGLLEMSRQRLRTGVVEGSTSQCPHCQGTGTVRSTESVALAVIRAIEDQLLRDARSSVTAVTTAEVALYILNNKRVFVTDMEHRYGVAIAVEASSRMQGANFAIEKSAAPAPAPAQSRAPERSAVNMEWGFETSNEDEGETERDEAGAVEQEDDGRRPRRRRRRGRRDDRGDRSEPHARFVPNGEAGPHERAAVDAGAHDETGDHAADEAPPRDEIPGSGEQPAVARADDDDRRGRRRRRGRRGGRRGRDREASLHNGAEDASDHGLGHQPDSDAASPGGVTSFDPAQEQSPPMPAPSSLVQESTQPVPARPSDEVRSDEPVRARRASRSSAPAAAPEHLEAVAGPAPEVARQVDPPDSAQDDPSRPARKGWWQRKFS